MGRKRWIFWQREGKTLVLEIDSPKDDISKRGKGFCDLRKTFIPIFIRHTTREMKDTNWL